MTDRRAVARAVVRMAPETAASVDAGDAPKGDVVGTARIAGIQAAKRTAELIPLCHPLPLSFVDVDAAVDAAAGTSRSPPRRARPAQTGVEMEAMTAASVAALTVYDMVKGVERGVEIAEWGCSRRAAGERGLEARMRVREVVERAWDRPGAERYERVRPELPRQRHRLHRGGLRHRGVERAARSGGRHGQAHARAAADRRPRDAVEPLEGMREVLVRELPDVAVLAGTAEQIPLPDGSVDVVLVGQAFHWFDPAEAPKEIVRVLRPGGGLVAIWNVRNESEGWTDQVRDLLDRHKGDTPRHSDDRWRVGIDSSGLFAPIELRLFDHAQELPREEAVETYASRSYVAAMPEGERAALLREVAAILPDEPMVTIPYTTQVYWTRRSP